MCGTLQAMEDGASRSISVTSITSGDGTVGKFNFKRSDIGLAGGSTCKLRVANARTGVCEVVRVYCVSDGGSTWDARGRYDSLGAKAGQFAVGDVLTENPK